MYTMIKQDADAILYVNGGPDYDIQSNIRLIFIEKFYPALLCCAGSLTVFILCL